MDTNGYGGKTLRKKVIVYTNDPKKPEIILFVSGFVEQFAEITPRTVKLKGSSEETVSQKILIKPSGKYPFSILDFRVHKGENIKVDFKKNSGNEKSWILIVTNIKKQVGKYFDRIILKTDHSEVPEITLRIHGDITGEKRLSRPPIDDDDDGPPIFKK